MSNLQLKTLHTISTCNIKTAFIYHNVYKNTHPYHEHPVHVHNYKLAYLYPIPHYTIKLHTSSWKHYNSTLTSRPTCGLRQSFTCVCVWVDVGVG